MCVNNDSVHNHTVTDIRGHIDTGTGTTTVHHYTPVGLGGDGTGGPWSTELTDTCTLGRGPRWSGNRRTQDSAPARSSRSRPGYGRGVPADPSHRRTSSNSGWPACPFRPVSTLPQRSSSPLPDSTRVGVVRRTGVHTCRAATALSRRRRLEPRPASKPPGRPTEGGDAPGSRTPSDGRHEPHILHSQVGSGRHPPFVPSYPCPSLSTQGQFSGYYRTSNSTRLPYRARFRAPVLVRTTQPSCRSTGHTDLVSLVPPHSLLPSCPSPTLSCSVKHVSKHSEPLLNPKLELPLPSVHPNVRLLPDRD